MLGSEFVDAVAAACAGDAEAFGLLHAALNPGLGRYLRFRAPERAAALGEGIWRELLVQLDNFAGDEAELRALLFTVAGRRLRDAGLDELPVRHDPWSLPADPVDRAVALLGSTVAPEQAQVVLLRVLGGLGVDDVAHVLRTTSGAVRLAQYRALVTLVYQCSNRAQQAPSEEALAGFLDVADPMPNLVFQGALPAWQARGALAPVARLVAAARRRPTDDETVPSVALMAAVAARRPDLAPPPERRARFAWAPSDRRARPRPTTAPAAGSGPHH